MAPAPDGRGRLPLLLVAAVVAVVVAVAAGVAFLAAQDDPEPAKEPLTRPAYAARELCDAVAPVLPADLGLGTGTLTLDSDPAAGRERASCTFGSSRGSSLVVDVASYTLRRGDPDHELDRLVLAACDEVERTHPAAYDGDEQGCSGRDVETATAPVEVSAVQVGRIVTRGAVVTVRLSDRRLPAQVAAYVSAIAYGVLAGDLQPPGSP